MLQKYVQRCISQTTNTNNISEIDCSTEFLSAFSTAKQIFNSQRKMVESRELQKGCGSSFYIFVAKIISSERVFQVEQQKASLCSALPRIHKFPTEAVVLFITGIITQICYFQILPVNNVCQTIYTGRPVQEPKAIGTQLKHRTFPLNMTEHFTVRGLSTGTGCPARWRVALLGDTLKMSGDSPGPLTASGHARAAGLDYRTSSDPFQSKPFCDSVMQMLYLH